MSEAVSRGSRVVSGTHGYVYVFHNPALGWTKIGMTSKPDEQACRGRIIDYVKAHGLSRHGWQFVCFIATYNPAELERRLHKRLRFMQVVQGKATEICSVSIDFLYAAILEQEDLLLDQSAIGDP